jgi:hypothetical protein
VSHVGEDAAHDAQYYVAGLLTLWLEDCVEEEDSIPLRPSSTVSQVVFK